MYLCRKSNANYSSDENGILYNKDKTELMFIPSASHWENNDTYLKYTDYQATII